MRAMTMRRVWNRMLRFGRPRRCAVRRWTGLAEADNADGREMPPRMPVTRAWTQPSEVRPSTCGRIPRRQANLLHRAPSYRLDRTAQRHTLPEPVTAQSGAHDGESGSPSRGEIGIIQH